MFELVYELPIQALAALVAAVFVGVYWMGCIWLRPFFRMLVRSAGGDNEMVGALLSAFGVLYGLLLSMIAVAAHQNLNEVESQVESEASALLALYRDASEYPPPLRDELRTELQSYCRYVIDDEWPLLRQGKRPQFTQQRIEPILQKLLALEHDSIRHEVIQRMALDHLELVREQGRHRRYSVSDAIPAVMWYVVIVGTLVNFALMWSFDMRFITQLFLGGLMAFFLGALIMLIAVLERPYRSWEFGVSPASFELVSAIMQEETANPADAPARQEQ